MGSPNGKYEDRKLWHRHDGQTRWREAKRVSFTPARILALASIIVRRPPPDVRAIAASLRRPWTRYESTENAWNNALAAFLHECETRDPEWLDG